LTSGYKGEVIVVNMIYFIRHHTRILCSPRLFLLETPENNRIVKEKQMNVRALSTIITLFVQLGKRLRWRSHQRICEVL
jgi:hypothetical protein